MKILLFGKNGQVGWELVRSLSVLGEVIALSSSSRDFCGNLSYPEGVASTVRKTSPQVIVIASAYTAVDKAESEPALAATLNRDSPAAIAREASRFGSLLVHYSTDYVYDGSGSAPRVETDDPRPLNVYGRTKLQGDNAIQEAGCLWLIFRTSWVHSPRNHNFPKTILRLAKQRESLNVVCDQIGAPTSAELLADATAHAILQTLDDPSKCGLYHLCASGETSWHEYAQFICQTARDLGHTLLTTKIEPVPSSAYPSIAKRPLNSRLDTSKFCRTFGLQLPPW
ncbi:MAG: dTDP-4-dehydrorhamnose reductase, partial [Chthoniobacterales bacterium]|nr:dTDP-4-dehydrorhamnose reductase [Chthoniobacterales bacterium]